MIDIIITSYNEPKATLRAVESFLKQKIKEEFRITVVDPFPEVGEFLKKHIKQKNFVFYLDSGEGKSYALNLLFQEYASQNSNDIFILTDGDVYVSEKSVTEILKAFEKKEVGCITGKPMSLDNKDSKYGYWSNLLFDGIDKVRAKLSDEQKFFECSGYLFAIRKNVILDFPMETSEDSIIPYLFWKKNYKIAYVPNAKVYVKNPSNWKDWTNQKIRNIKAHENLNKIAPDMPRTKSFFGEIKNGFLFTLFYPKNLKQFWWTLELIFARLYIYLRAFAEIKNKKKYGDGWRENEIQSTKPLD